MIVCQAELVHSTAGVDFAAATRGESPSERLLKQVTQRGLAVLGTVGLAGLLLCASSGAAIGKRAVLRISDTETFNCAKNADLCEAIGETSSSSHEEAVLFSDHTAKEHLSAHCRASIPEICPQGATLVVSERFNWFTAPATCDKNGCVPLSGPCTPNPFQPCTPIVWRDKPDLWRFIGCRTLSPDFAFACARHGSPAAMLTNPFESLGASYPDDTFWPAVPGHYRFSSPEEFGPEACRAFRLRHCPPPGINLQIQVTSPG